MRKNNKKSHAFKLKRLDLHASSNKEYAWQGQASMLGLLVFLMFKDEQHIIRLFTLKKYKEKDMLFTNSDSDH